MLNTHIIIVNYNTGDWLGRCLNSAFQYSKGLISIVDNASADHSVDLAKQLFPQDERVEWIENSTNLGFAAANNQVLRKTKSEFVVLMNPDCEINEQTLELILNEFEKTPRLGIASCKIFNADGSVQSTCRRKFPTPWSALSRVLFLYKLFPGSRKLANFDYGDLELTEGDAKLEFIEAVSGAFMVVRTSAMNQVGLLDEGYFMHCEDLDWCKRFDLAGWDVGFVPAATVKHAKGVSSAARPVLVLWSLHKGMIRFFDKFYQQQYSYLFRLLVKLGVLISFVGRSCKALLRGVFSRQPH